MNYMKIDKCSISNGTGFRVVLWVAGCPHHCEGCHNPETWNHNNGKIFDMATKEELFSSLDKPYIDGITFSGGDPLSSYNINGIRILSFEIRNKFPNKTQWLYTGFTWQEIEKDEGKIDAIKNIDVLVDGRFVKEKRDVTLPFRGSSNQNIINIKDKIKFLHYTI